MQCATARRNVTRHRAAQHGKTDSNLKESTEASHRTPRKAPHQHATHRHRRPHTGPPRAQQQQWRTTQKVKPAPQKRKDTNNPSSLTQSHTQPPGAAAQPAEPVPNPAGRGAKPNVYIAHPTHGARTRPSRTQLPTAARKTTLKAGQCVRQPREGRGRNRQPPPPKIKKKGGGGAGGAKTAHSHQTARKHHKRRPNPPPRRHRRQDPQRGTGGRPSQNRQHQARNSGPPGKATPKLADTHHGKKKRASSPARKKGDRGTGTTWPGSKGHYKVQSRQAKKSAKNTPRQPSQGGRGTAETRAQNACPHTAPQPGKAGNKRGAPTNTHPRTATPR